MPLDRPGPSGTLPAILVGGGMAATFDIVYAFARQAGRGRSPEWVLQSVASGWLGERAFIGGIPAALLGLLSHYGILLVAALLYVLAARRLPVLREHSMIAGALFGAAIYLFMNFVVIPLSAFPFTLSYPVAKLVEGLIAHAVFVGIPIAAAARRFG